MNEGERRGKKKGNPSPTITSLLGEKEEGMNGRVIRERESKGIES